MKNKIAISLAVMTTAITFFSCKKNNDLPPHSGTMVDKKVQFVLYSTQNFSDNNSLITFTLRITNNNAVLWDSVMAPVKIKDIPGSGNKIVIEKNFLCGSTADLTAGFLYRIENVGLSWYIEQFSAAEKTKTIDFNFR